MNLKKNLHRQITELTALQCIKIRLLISICRSTQTVSLGALKCFTLDQGCTFEVNAVTLLTVISAYSALIHSVEWCWSAWSRSLLDEAKLAEVLQECT